MRALLIVTCCVVLFTPALAGDSKTNSDDRIYKIGYDVKPPKPILTRQPEAQKAARNKPGHKSKELTGVVVLSCYVGKDGRVHDAKVVRSANAELDAAALKVVSEWEFQPCTRKGVPVNCAFGMEVSFHLTE